MNPEFARIKVEPKTQIVRATLRWNDGSEKVFSKDDLRYRLGNCSEVQENEDAYQLAIESIARVEALLEARSEFGKYIISFSRAGRDK